MVSRDGSSKSSRRLVRDLEAKGIVRTAVECTNLSIHANDSDVLTAECIRTFPTVTFPASMLLKREEIECGNTLGLSVITPVHHGGGQRRPAYQEAPFDLLYGFRGCTHNVDLLSPYEMLLHWSLERIDVPTKKGGETSRATWTSDGIAYREACSKERIQPKYIPGIHFVAKEADNRIILPELQQLFTLRHCWCWEKRNRPHLPTWSYAKVPQGSFSP